MKYLCLIYLDEQKMAALPAGEMNALNAGHLALNDALRASGHFIEAEALEPAATAAWLRARHGKPTVTGSDGGVRWTVVTTTVGSAMTWNVIGDWCTASPVITNSLDASAPNARPPPLWFWPGPA